MSNVRWYATWAAVVVLLIAAPVAIILMHHNDAAAVTADAFDPPSASPTPTAVSSPSASSSSTDAPDLTDVPLCANVWQDGKMLPTDYSGCQVGGAEVKPKKAKCLITYQDSWWAQPGQKVQESKDKVTDDKRYAVALAHC
jgi:hypothetical protein